MQCEKYSHLFKPITIHGMTIKNRLVMPPMIRLADDGQSATGTFCLFCTMTLIDENGKEGAYVEIGKYKNEYVRENGQWKFRKLYGNMEKASPWEKGWVNAPFSAEL